MTPDATFEGLVTALTRAVAVGKLYSEHDRERIAREHANAIRAAVAEEIAQAIEAARDDDHAARHSPEYDEECDAEHWRCHADAAYVGFSDAAAIARRVGGER